MAEQEAIRASPFSVILPFWSNSPLLNRWKINDLLPEKCNKRILKQMWGKVKQNLEKRHSYMAKCYNRKRAAAPFTVGDLVYYLNHPVSHAGRNVTAKLFHRWKGPFKIDKFSPPVTVRIVDPATSKLVTRAHVSLLKPDLSTRL